MFIKKKLEGQFFTTKGFYIFHIPVSVPYKKIYALADAAGVKKKAAGSPILEKGSIFGNGWIGIEIEPLSEARADVVTIAGTFETYEHRGAYKTLGKAFRKIKKERPAVKELFNYYLDDPEKVAPENCRTEIYIR